MVAKPLCPLYKNIIKPLDRARYPELRYFLHFFLMISIDLRFLYYLGAKVQLFGDKRLFTSYHNMFKISENNNKK